MKALHQAFRYGQRSRFSRGGLRRPAQTVRPGFEDFCDLLYWATSLILLTQYFGFWCSF